MGTQMVSELFFDQCLVGPRLKLVQQVLEEAMSNNIGSHQRLTEAKTELREHKQRINSAAQVDAAEANVSDILRAQLNYLKHENNIHIERDKDEIRARLVFPGNLTLADPSYYIDILVYREGMTVEELKQYQFYSETTSQQGRANMVRYEVNLIDSELLDQYV